MRPIRSGRGPQRVEHRRSLRVAPKQGERDGKKTDQSRSQTGSGSYCGPPRLRSSVSGKEIRKIQSCCQESGEESRQQSEARRTRTEPIATSSKVFAHSLEERMAQFALSGLRPVFDFDKQRWLDPNAAVRD